MRFVPTIYFRNGVELRVDWRNLESVIQYAVSLGPGQSVIKVPGRGNYNIIHTVREGEYPQATVYFRTSDPELAIRDKS